MWLRGAKGRPASPGQQRELGDGTRMAEAARVVMRVPCNFRVSIMQGRHALAHGVFACDVS